jgi:2-hydroxychromene-2-carboxylate isomerase
LVARQAGDGQRCYDALVAARWGAGLDICDDAVFTRVLTDAGLDGAALSAAARNEATRAEGVNCLAAAHEDGIFGVPYLRLGRQRFWGYDRVEMFLDELRRRPVTDPPPVPAGIPVGAYDRDTAGGCG